MNESDNPYAPPASELPLVAELVVTDGGFSIDYELVLEDIVKWNLVLHRVSPATRRSHRLIQIMCGALMILFGFFSVVDWPHSWHFLVMAAGIGLMGALWPAIFRWRAGAMIRNVFREGKNLSVLGARRLTLTPQYILYSSPLMQVVTRWVGIERVVVEPDAIYIMSSATSAFIVPRRALADEAQFRRFAETATQFHAQSNA